VGWKDKENFRQALELARRDYRGYMLEQGTTEALSILSSTAPDAARLMRQRVVGDGGALGAPCKDGD